MSAVAERQQRDAALESANTVRSAMRLWKEEMAALTATAGRREAARVLMEEPGRVGSLTVHAFLVAVPKIGEEKARRILCGRGEGWYIWPFRRVRELTARQRELIAERLRAG